MSQRSKTKRGLSGSRRRCGCSWCLGKRGLENGSTASKRAVRNELAIFYKQITDEEVFRNDFGFDEYQFDVVYGEHESETVRW